MPSRIEDIKRATQVVRTLHKYGLGKILRQAGLGWHLHILDRHRIKEALPEDMPQTLRKVMEELGGAYVKLGQLLSIRPDLIPMDYCEEFSKLQDNVHPESFETIEKMIQAELTLPVGKLFSHIDRKPLGSASIAQVHKARLRTGHAVVIKIQRPNVREKFEEDIDILKYLAKKIDQHVKGIDLLAIIEEFEKYTKTELDFRKEAENISLLRETNTPSVIIPKVYDAYTTPSMIVMDYIEGEPVHKLKDKNAKKEVAKILINFTLVQVFEKGIFHADLHPGNILYTKEHKIGLLDYGIVGNISKKTIDLGIKMYMAILARDSEKATEVILEYGEETKDTDIKGFKRDAENLIDNWHRQYKITHLLYKLFLLCGQYKIRLPKDTVLLGKALVTAEGTARQLDPDFDFISYGKEKLLKILKAKRTPSKMLKEFAEKSTEMAEILAEIPKEALELVRTIKSGRAVLEIDDTKFRKLGRDVTKSSNRLSYALISASSILAASQLHNVPPFVNGYSLPVTLMYMLATVFIILLVLSILREER